MKDVGPDVVRSEDRLLHGRLICRQPVDGYRFSIDSILLAGFARLRKHDAVLDLGAGCGVVSLLLAHQHPHIQVTALELQRDLAGIAEENVRQNDLDSRVQVIRGDLREAETLFPAGRFSHVVCNPPYYAPASGRESRDISRAMARHGRTAALEQVVKALAWCTKTGGRVSLVYPADGCAGLVAHMVQQKIAPKRLRPVYSYPDTSHGQNARLVLIEGVRAAATGLQFLPPLYIYTKKNGPYTDEVAALYMHGEMP